MLFIFGNRALKQPTKGLNLLGRLFVLNTVIYHFSRPTKKMYISIACLTMKMWESLSNVYVNAIYDEKKIQNFCGRKVQTCIVFDIIDVTVDFCKYL